MHGNESTARKTGDTAGRVDTQRIDYQQLFENATAGIGRSSISSGEVLLANPRLAQIFGYDSPEEFIADYNFAEHYPDQNGRERQLEFYEKNPGRLVEATFTDRHGELIYVEAEVRLDRSRDWIDFVIIDVSERERARRELRQSQREYKRLFENAAVGIGRNRVSDGRILLANQRLADMFGYPNPEAMMAEFEFASSYVDPGQRDRMMQAFDDNPIQVSEQSFYRKDGSILTVLSCDMHRADEDACDYILIDISDLVRERDKRLQSERLIDALVHGSPIPLSIKDLEGRYLFTSPALARYLGMPVEQLEGTMSTDILDAEDARAVAEADARIVSTRKPLPTEASFRIRHGESILQVSKFPVLDADGEVGAIGTIGIDVTDAVANEAALADALARLERHSEGLERAVEARTRELQEMDEHFGRFIDAMPDACTVSDLETGECLRANAAFCRRSGWTPEELIGRTTTEIGLWKHYTDRERLVASLKERGYVADLMVECVRKDGSTWPALLSAYELLLGGRKVIVSASKDVSELQQAQQEALRASRAKSEFLSSMSHELRTPLNAILGFAQLLQLGRTPLTAEQQKAVRLIRSSGEHLLELVNRVLDLARIESGNFRIECCRVDTAGIVDECVQIARKMGAERSIEVELELPEPTPAVDADPVCLRQVLLNFVSNAVKYNRDGGSISVSLGEGSAGYLKFSIRDTGPGIEPRHREAIFEPFRRLGRERQEDTGIGIGLTISRQIVEQMNGRIGFESEPGQGTEFWIEMPLAADPGPGESREEESPSSVALAARTADNGERVVLCVEDNATSAALISSIFEEIDGLRLLLADSGESGIETARRENPDIVIMDIGLPDMDGIEATRRIREIEALRNVPVIALTASAMAADREKAREAKFARYITKPFKLEEFIAAIETELG